MAEGINMGRLCPWSKEEVINLYKKVDGYAKKLSLYLMKTEGMKSAAEAFAAYNMFKLPVVYIFIHYHYGKFEDLGMSNNDIQVYTTMFMMQTKSMTEAFADGMRTQDVFYYDHSFNQELIDFCDEVLYILNM